jgi:hypothetical protein
MFLVWESGRQQKTCAEQNKLYKFMHWLTIEENLPKIFALCWPGATAGGRKIVQTCFKSQSIDLKKYF